MNYWGMNGRYHEQHHMGVLENGELYNGFVRILISVSFGQRMIEQWIEGHQCHVLP